MSKIKFHKTLDSLPIYNYNKLYTENDLRYLIYNVDVFDLPPFEELKDIDLEKAYNTFISSMKYKKYMPQIHYYNCQSYFLDYLNSRDKKDLQKYENEFARYLTSLDDVYFKFGYKGKTYKTCIDLYVFFKTKYTLVDDYLDFLKDRLFNFSYQNIKAEQKNKFDLYKILGDLLINNINIDEYTCSVTKFNNVVKILSEKNKK